MSNTIDNIKELEGVKALIVNKSTVKTFTSDNRIERLKTGELDTEDFKQGFDINKILNPIDSIYLKWLPYEKLDDGTQTYKSETITTDMHVTGLDDVSNDKGESRLKCTVPAFTIKDKINDSDVIYAYKDGDKLFKPYIRSVDFSNTKIHKGIITFKVNVIYNYNEKLKIRIKINDKQYGEYTQEFNPYDGVTGLIQSNTLDAGPNTITVEIATIDETKKVETKIENAITVINNEPSCKIVTADSDSFKLHFLCEDADMEDKISYQISLQGDEGHDTVLVPWTEYQQQPLNVKYAINNKNVKIDKDNILKIEFKDDSGALKNVAYSFIGKYNNIVFVDERGDYYSTDTGDILQVLDFENIIAGGTTDERKITIKNSSNVSVSNINISSSILDNTNKDVDIEFSKTINPFVPKSKLDYGKEMLQSNQSKDFYVRLSSNNVKSEGLCKFQIICNSKVVK